jgi:mRNA-degrading endonuclease RelE of RelBE toxin-antitoxin system
MKYDIVLGSGALEDLSRLRKYDRTQVRQAIEKYLRHEPAKTSKSRIKRLRGLQSPQYRLRVGDDIRVFFDVIETNVAVLAVIYKDQVAEWLEREGVPE